MPEMEVEEYVNRLRSQGVPADKLAEILERLARRLRNLGSCAPDPTFRNVRR